MPLSERASRGPLRSPKTSGNLRTMMDPSPAARRIAEFAAKNPAYSVIAFDADGNHVDWMISGSWVNGSDKHERRYVFGGGGVSEIAVQCELDRQDSNHSR